MLQPCPPDLFVFELFADLSQVRKQAEKFLKQARTAQRYPIWNPFRPLSILKRCGSHALTEKGPFSLRRREIWKGRTYQMKRHRLPVFLKQPQVQMPTQRLHVTEAADSLVLESLLE